MSVSRLPTEAMGGQDIKTKKTLDEQIISLIRNDGERYLYDIDKNLIKLFGKPIIQSALDTLTDSEYAGNISVVGPETVGEWLRENNIVGNTNKGSIGNHDITYALEGKDRVVNALIGRDALGEKGPHALYSVDTPLMDREFSGDVNLYDKFVEELMSSIQNNDLVFPAVTKSYMKDQWGEAFRPNPKSWSTLWHPPWQDESHETDTRYWFKMSDPNKDFFTNPFNFVNEIGTWPNVYAKESNIQFVNYDNVTQNVDQLGDITRYMKLKDFDNIKKGVGLLVDMIKKNNDGKAAWPLTYSVYHLAHLLTNTHIRHSKWGKYLPGQMRWSRSITHQAMKQIGEYVLGVPADKIAIPESRVFEQHADIDSLEDAYLLARNRYRTTHGGEDIHSYRELEHEITYKADGKEAPLINQLNYDTTPMASLTTRKEDWMEINKERFGDLETDGHGNILNTGFLSKAIMMKEFFYKKMDNQLRIAQHNH